MALVGPDGRPLTPEVDPSQVFKTMVKQEDDGTYSVCLVHTGTGAYLVFSGDGTIEIKDGFGSKVKTLPTGDIVVSGSRYVVNNAEETFFRKPDGSSVLRIFGAKEPNFGVGDPESSSVSYQVGQLSDD